MGFREAFLKARWGRGILGCVISLCTILWLVEVRSQGCVIGVKIINPKPLGGLGARCSWSPSNFYHLKLTAKQLRNMHQTLLFRYFGGDGKQWMWDRGQSRRPCWVLLGFISPGLRRVGVSVVLRVSTDAMWGWICWLATSVLMRTRRLLIAQTLPADKDGASKTGNVPWAKQSKVRIHLRGCVTRKKVEQNTPFEEEVKTHKIKYKS